MSITHILTNFVSQYGLAALFATLTLESLGAPVPGESAILVTSGLAAKGDLNPYAVVIVAFAGAVLGDNIGYLIGRKFGRPAVIRYGSRVGITDKVYDRAERIMQRRGPIVVIGARFVALLRQMNGLVAGSTGMRWHIFLAANIVGAALWAGVYTFIGFSLGKSPDIIPDVIHHLTLIAMIVIPALIIGAVELHFLHKRRKRGDRE